MGFAQAHDRAFTVSFDDISQGFVEHGAPGFADRFIAVEGIEDIFFRCGFFAMGAVLLENGLINYSLFLL
jgi:hypothetical protein